jgi:hypothetical protein
MEVLNMDENDDDYDIDEENWIFLLMYDYVVNVQQVHQLMKILHCMKTNDNYRVDFERKQQEYDERFHIVNNQELYRVLKMNVVVVAVAVGVEQLNRQEKNEEEVQQQLLSDQIMLVNELIMDLTRRKTRMVL